ncbi:hypothetical protein [Phreatobacter sp.]|uniref:hypothetical protein n=1 Tax=Phreatobacter sp. TaxID=1966341 RepID=UPI003F729B29
MAARATAERADSASEERGKRRTAATGKRPAARRKPAGQARPAPAGGGWLSGWRTAVLATLLAAAAALATVHLAGHAPSWRSLAVVSLQAVPLLPGIALLWWALDAGRRRLPGLPLALWLAFALVGTAAVMLVFPGIAFAIHSRSAAIADHADTEIQLIHHAYGVAAAFYLYVTTAFRLWWPWGAVVPAFVAIRFWLAQRR